VGPLHISLTQFQSRACDAAMQGSGRDFPHTLLPLLPHCVAQAALRSGGESGAGPAAGRRPQWAQGGGARCVPALCA
jgi:hypothetical protein